MLMEVPSLAGQYRLPGSIGSQVLSLKRTGSATRFGSSTRDNASKVYISAEHEKGFVGLASPGPCTAMHVPIGGTYCSAIADAARLPVTMTGAADLYIAAVHTQPQRSCQSSSCLSAAGSYVRLVRAETSIRATVPLQQAEQSSRWLCTRQARHRRCPVVSRPGRV